MTDITTSLPAKVATAIKRAYALGQLYWQQADSDSYKQNAKSDETRAKFDELLFQASANAQEAADEIDRLRAEVAGKDAQIARMRDALTECIPALEIGLESARVISIFGDERPNAIRDALNQARAALAPAAEVSNG